MVSFKNCSLIEAKNKFQNRKIILYGAGSWLNAVSYSELSELKDDFCYVIDHMQSGKRIKIEDKELNVYSPEILYDEDSCIIILTSPVYGYEMYRDLLEMDLSAEIDCYSFPFMLKITPSIKDDILLDRIRKSSVNPKIPKIVHSFWFSGDPKGDSYQKCLDTWRDNLSDYEIIEWNLVNYDICKHPFLKKAIECKAWAFASDFARLDVLNEYGGIYMDMDIEVFKNFDDLLGNEAILSFSNHTMIDLAFCASTMRNPIINKLLDIYDKIIIPQNREEFSTLFQPSLVRDTLAGFGIKMNGALQKVEHATVFPQEFFMPLDVVLFEDYKKTENTYCVHYDNFGWSFDGECKRGKKIHDNRKLWKMINE